MKLRTFCVYGLNEKGSVENKNSNKSNNDEAVVRKIFLPLPRARIRQVTHPRYTE